MIGQFENIAIVAFDSNRAEEFFELIESNREVLDVYFAGTTSKTKTLQETLLYAKEIDLRIEERSYFPYFLINTTCDTLMGYIDVKNIDWNIPKAELGYFIDKEYQGKGITSKAVAVIIPHIVTKYAFKKLLCRAGAENTGSIKVALKNGFELEGTIRRDYRTSKGDLVDLNYYGRIF